MDESAHAGGTHQHRILLVADPADTGTQWQHVLRRQGLDTVLVTSPEEALARWSNVIADLILVDVARPDVLDLCKQLRAVSVTPILLLLEDSSSARVIAAYTAGVDEVAIKPLHPTILVAKTLSWLRRSRTVPLEGLSLIQTDTHVLDPARRALIQPGGNEVRLTNLEFRLLFLLMSHPGRVFGPEEIVRSVWGSYGRGDHVSLKNIVYRLRRKIERDSRQPRLLKTAPGGYRFEG